MRHLLPPLGTAHNQATLRMQPTLLANTWMAAHFPGTEYMAVLCCAGSAGETAFHNSLDEAFAETGNQHLPATLHQRRPATYQIEGTAADEGGALVTVHRIVHSGQRVLNPPVFHHAGLFSNAVVLDILLEAVTLDMSSLTALLGAKQPRCWVPLRVLEHAHHWHLGQRLVPPGR